MTQLEKLTRLRDTLDLLRRREEEKLAAMERAIALFEEERSALFNNGHDESVFYTFIDIIVRRASSLDRQIASARTSAANLKKDLRIQGRRIAAVEERIVAVSRALERRAEEARVLEWLDLRQASKQPHVA